MKQCSGKRDSGRTWRDVAHLVLATSTVNRQFGAGQRRCYAVCGDPPIPSYTHLRSYPVDCAFVEEVPERAQASDSRLQTGGRVWAAVPLARTISN